MRKIIVGLGNPGTKYRYTRHNVGFILLDQICSELDKHWRQSAKFDGKFCTTENALYLKPQGFMNTSGSAVSACMKYYDITTDNLCVIHDDLDLPFLKIKADAGAGAAGHHGVEDIIQKLGTKNFKRLRIGIGRPENPSIDPADWVLSIFNKAELEELKKLTKDVRQLI